MKLLLRDLLNNIWVFVGLFIAWFVMEGTARTVAAYLYIGAFIVWMASVKIRNHKEIEDEKEKKEA